MMTNPDGVCLLGTHLDPAWSSPAGYQATLERYIGQTESDGFVYVSSPDRNEGTWAYDADTVIMSDDGRLPADDRDELLATYDQFHHLGAYYDACHFSTWDSLLAGIYEESRETAYEIIFPATGITESDTTLEEMITEEHRLPSTPLLTGREPVDDYVDAAMEPYEDAATSRADAMDRFSYSFDPEEMTITWTLEPEASN